MARLSPIARELDLHLVGGTAIALQLGHRHSADLDLFSRGPGLDLESARRRLLVELPRTQIIELSPVILRARVGSTPLDIVAYPYAPLSAPRRGAEGVPIAGLADLAAMKLAAIARRGIRRDFWDLHAIITGSRIGLRAAIDAYSKKFGAAEPDLYPVLRSLLYFGDADDETIWPRGLTQRHWETIKSDLARLVPRAIDAR